MPRWPVDQARTACEPIKWKSRRQPWCGIWGGNRQIALQLLAFGVGRRLRMDATDVRASLALSVCKSIHPIPPQIPCDTNRRQRPGHPGFQQSKRHRQDREYKHLVLICASHSCRCIFRQCRHIGCAGEVNRQNAHARLEGAGRFRFDCGAFMRALPIRSELRERDFAADTCHQPASKSGGYAQDGSFHDSAAGCGCCLPVRSVDVARSTVRPSRRPAHYEPQGRCTSHD